jgi:hypothetical protein
MGGERHQVLCQQPRTGIIGELRCQVKRLSFREIHEGAGIPSQDTQGPSVLGLSEETRNPEIENREA